MLAIAAESLFSQLNDLAEAVGSVAAHINLLGAHQHHSESEGTEKEWSCSDCRVGRAITMPSAS